MQHEDIRKDLESLKQVNEGYGYSENEFNKQYYTVQRHLWKAVGSAKTFIKMLEAEQKAFPSTDEKENEVLEHWNIVYDDMMQIIQLYEKNLEYINQE